MIEKDAIYTVKMRTFEETCQGREPDMVGLIECENQFLFGPLQEGMRLLVSFQEVQDFIDENELTSFPIEELSFVFIVESAEPLIIDWRVFTEEEIDEMDREDEQNSPILH
jgi:hypothetical protein